jgi:hypothetical protein
MSPESTGKQIGIVSHDETVGKVFIVVSDDTRRCAVCDQLFTRQASFEHSKLPCYPSTYSCEAQNHRKDSN